MDIVWADDWINQHYWEFDHIKSCCKEYNKQFGTNISQDTFRHHCKRNLNLQRNYTAEQDEWLTNKYPHLGAEKVCKEFNETFMQHRTVESISSHCSKFLGLHVTEECLRLINSQHSGHNNPIGTILRFNDHELRIKVSDEIGKGNGNWKPLTHYEYEKHYGAVPQGHVVIFLDNDHTNYSKDNLMAVSTRCVGLLNGHKLKSSNPTLTKAGVLWCELQERLQSV